MKQNVLPSWARAGLYTFFWCALVALPATAMADGDIKSTITSTMKELFSWGQGLALIYGAWGLVLAGASYGDTEQAHLGPVRVKRAIVALCIICLAVAIVQFIKARLGVQTIP